MRIDYVGQCTECEYRYAVISSTTNEQEKRNFIINEIDRLDGRQINGFGDPETQSDWIVVEDRDDYEWIKKIYKNAKKAYGKTQKGE